MTTAAQTEHLQETVRSIEREVSKVIVGQRGGRARGRDLAGGRKHTLLEGVARPRKTLLVRILSEVLDLQFSGSSSRPT